MSQLTLEYLLHLRRCADGVRRIDGECVEVMAAGMPGPVLIPRSRFLHLIEGCAAAVADQLHTMTPDPVPAESQATRSKRDYLGYLAPRGYRNRRR